MTTCTFVFRCFQDDVEAIVKAIEEEERKRQEVKEVKVEAPSHRSNLSIVPHPEAPEIVFFGGEFFNGQKVSATFCCLTS